MGAHLLEPAFSIFCYPCHPYPCYFCPYHPFLHSVGFGFQLFDDLSLSLREKKPFDNNAKIKGESSIPKIETPKERKHCLTSCLMRIPSTIVVRFNNIMVVRRIRESLILFCKLILEEIYVRAMYSYWWRSCVKARLKLMDNSSGCWECCNL